MNLYMPQRESHPYIWGVPENEKRAIRDVADSFFARTIEETSFPHIHLFPQKSSVVMRHSALFWSQVSLRRFTGDHRDLKQ